MSAVIQPAIAASERVESSAQSDLRDTLPIIIVGAGPVGVYLVGELQRQHCHRPIILFGDEPNLPYNRIKLSSLLAGDIRYENILSPIEGFANDGRVQYITSRIEQIDRENKTVADAQGEVYRYHTLVLATGSRPHIPSIPGVTLPNVFTFRDLKDTEQLKARTASSRHVVVIGGGLLGIETARALQQAGTKVTIVQQSEHLMNHQLDDRAASFLEASLLRRKIDVLKGHGVREISGDPLHKISGVLLRNGDEISCDTVVICAGIKPNIELARQAWLKVGHGIRVDDQLKTSDSSIYAVGECIEHRGQTYGLVSPGYEQAAVAAANIAGQSPCYQGSANVSQLKVAELPVFSAGEAAQPCARPQLREIRYQDKRNRLYRKIVLCRGHLIGALAIGDWDQLSRVKQALTQQDRIRPWQWIWFRLTGDLWSHSNHSSIKDWPDSTIICNCNGVSKQRITTAIEQGCTTPQAVSECTGASTVCGSCQPLVASLLGGSVARQPTQGLLALLAITMAVLALLATFVSLPAVPVSETVRDKGFLEFFWNDGFWQQVTGFSLLGLTLIGLLLSARKRVRRVQWGAFAWWRVAHIGLGLAALLVLFAHTGMSLGSNLNQWLIVDFLAITALGALASVVVAFEHKLPLTWAGRLRRQTGWLHILLFWPLPVLLITHIVSVYYF